MGTEVMASMKYSADQLGLDQQQLRLVGEQPRPVKSVWRLEAETMRDLGSGMREVALNLPGESVLRESLLDQADGWLRQARMRGVACETAASA